MVFHNINQYSNSSTLFGLGSLNAAAQKLFYLVIVCLFIQGCAETTRVIQGRDDGLTMEDVRSIPGAIPRYEPPSRSGNPSSYVVFGKRYQVMKGSKGFVQRGLASWYGKKFHGRRTSNGERYNMYSMTAAHKTLPLPTYVQVTNLNNGRRLILRVNDRGPFYKGRIIDLSYGAARKLGMARAGTANVEVRALHISTTNNEIAAQSTARQPLYVQIGAFSERANADKLLNSIHGDEIPSLPVKTGRVVRQPIYRVQIGPVNSVGEAERIIKVLGRRGITQTRLVNNDSDSSQVMLQ